MSGRTAGLPKIHAHPDDEAEKYLGDTFEEDDSAVGVGYDREQMIDAYHAGWDRARELTARHLAAPQAAPELRAAMAETNAVRDGYARLCEEFGDHSQSGQSARISLTVLNRHRQAAGLPARRRPAAGERPRDPYMKLLEQRDDLAATLSALIDRTEGTGVLTDDERAEYRRRARQEQR